MVVMDRDNYIDKAISLLADTNTYKTITKGSTTKLKNKLSQTLRDIKTKEDSVTTDTGKCTSPAQLPQNFMAFPKYTKLAPLSVIVSSRGSITYGVAKEPCQHH